MATKKENPQENAVPAADEAQDVKGKQKAPVSRKKTSSKKVVLDVKAKESAVKGSAKATAKESAKKPAKNTVKAKVEPEKKAETKAAEKAPETTVEKTAIQPVKEAAQTQEKTSPEKKTETEKHNGLDNGALVFGGGLLIMGLVLMLGRLLAIPFGAFLWPFIFIIPGALVLFAALSSESSSGEGLSILGGILTSLGFLFLAQSITGWWASWAYAWSLIAPGSVGVSQMLYGQSHNRPEIVKSGRRLINIGLTIFVIGFIFFELVIGISGFGLRRFGLPMFPMILIFTGLLILFNSLWRNRR